MGPMPRAQPAGEWVLGGGWATLYFTTYAMYGLEAARVIHDPLAGICGLAAAQKQVIHAAHVDERHANGFPGMGPHGHYAVPFVSGGETLGVLILSLPDGHQLRYATRHADAPLTLLFVHGWPDSWRSFQPVMKARILALSSLTEW